MGIVINSGKTLVWEIGRKILHWRLEDKNMKIDSIELFLRKHTEFMYLTIESSCQLLWTQWRNCRFDKRRRQVYRLFASREGPCPMGSIHITSILYSLKFVFYSLHAFTLLSFSLLLRFQPFIRDLFRLVRKITKSNSSFLLVCLSVRLSAWNNSASTGPIFMQLDIWIFFENLSRKLKFI